jgi:hypothetical protein
MRKYLLAIAIASGALISVSAQAAPVSSAASGVQNQVTGDAVKVYHCRSWSGGWHCGGGYGGWGHGRYWSHRRWGSGGWGGGWGHSRHWSHRRHGSWSW